MTVRTSKGVISLEGATSVTLRTSPLSYVPKAVGLALIVLSIIFAVGLGAEYFREGGYPRPRWWELVIGIGIILAILYAAGTSGFNLLFAKDESDDLRASLWGVIIPLALFGIMIFGIAVIGPDHERNWLIGIGFALCGSCFLIWQSQKWVGLTDAVVSYAGHRAVLRALSRREAQSVATSFEQKA